MVSERKTKNTSGAEPHIFQTMGNQWIVIDIRGVTHKFQHKEEADEFFNEGQYKN